jgi:hypothetical protein
MNGDIHTMAMQQFRGRRTDTPRGTSNERAFSMQGLRVWVRHINK